MEEVFGFMNLGFGEVVYGGEVVWVASAVGGGVAFALGGYGAFGFGSVLSVGG